jgi:hypothetical protein
VDGCYAGEDGVLEEKSGIRTCLASQGGKRDVDSRSVYKRKPSVTQNEGKEFKICLVAPTNIRGLTMMRVSLWSMSYFYQSSVSMPLVPSQNMHLEHMNVKTTFHNNLYEQIYMDQTKSFKNMNGLKHSHIQAL